MVAKSSLLQSLPLFGSLVAAALSSSKNGKVTSVDIKIPATRSDDQYYVVEIDFGGQTLPVLLDTGSGDLLVASEQCNTTDTLSGCYLMTEQFILNDDIEILSNETFYTVVGSGQVWGNQSIIPVTMGDITIPNFGTPLIYAADEFEFQSNSFSGILGLAPRNVSRQVYFNNRLPTFDTMITEGLVEEPVLSITLPRLDDPESPEVGKLTLGGIEDIEAADHVKYNDLVDTPNYGYDNSPLSPMEFTTVLQAIRMNGVEVEVGVSSLVSGGYLSMFDSGAQQILLRYPEFTEVANLFKGETIIQDGHAVYFECSIPQLLEFKYHGDWFAVDPLDLIISNDHGLVNGTQMCHSVLSTWDRTFADSIMGVPFMRNALTVFDYKNFDMYSKQPRVGLASLTDGNAAMARYASTYLNRLH